VETNLKAAFLGSMADSGIVFNNGVPALGRPVWQKLPEAPANSPKLIWGPEFADAASSGDLGYTTGPYYFEKPDGQRVNFGHYFTVWGRQADGGLKFLTDIGIHHATPTSSDIPTQVMYSSTPGVSNRKSRRADVLTQEQQLYDAIGRQGAAPAYAAVLSAQSRLYREGLTPFTTSEAIKQQLGTEPALRFQPLGSQVSSAGDLGYVYGTYQAATAADVKGGYAHVWKREKNGWRLVAEVLNPTNPPKAQQGG
jgi:ketosteroid isomerase-like protein